MIRSLNMVIHQFEDCQANLLYTFEIFDEQSICVFSLNVRLLDAFLDVCVNDAGRIQHFQ